MTRKSALLGLICALGVTACAPQYVETIAASPADLPERRAFFPGQPEVLNDSFRAACNDPGDQYVRPNRAIRQCRTLPTPDLAAFLLVQYDGALEVPSVVIQTEARPRGDEVEIGFSYFAEVPQKAGAPRRIYFRDRKLDRFIDLLLVASGGTLPAD